MNRRERRAAQKRQGSVAAPAGRARDAAAELFAQAVRRQHEGKLDEAAKLYRRAIAAAPQNAQAYNNLGCIFLAQGKAARAAAQFERALMLQPELLDRYEDVGAILMQVNPALADWVARAGRAWPQLLPVEELLGPAGMAALSGDPLLRFVLESAPVRDIGLERFLASARRAVLEAAANPALPEHAEKSILGFACALARQCFVNEYVFATAPEESEKAARLGESLTQALAGGGPVRPLPVAAVASYFPLRAFSDPQALLQRAWPEALAAVMTQQVREPLEEEALRESIPRLTRIGDETSLRVRRQYEENPYPRWVLAAARREPISIEQHIYGQFPGAPFRPVREGDGVDFLVAGCGTGRQAIEIAQRYDGARVLAVDLSLASLGYAKRKALAAGVRNVEWAQADILELESLGRTFHVIDASGVLHHLSDPLAGWRALLAALRPGGLMRLGLYSQLGRSDIVAARAFIAARGYRPNLEDIRRCRQELMTTPLGRVARFADFFCASECRDLLFHVEEHRLTIPEIASFIAQHDLRFIGFEFDPQQLAQHRAHFPDARSMCDLARWLHLERAHPHIFASMYQFWVQKG